MQLEGPTPTCYADYPPRQPMARQCTAYHIDEEEDEEDDYGDEEVCNNANGFGCSYRDSKRKTVLSLVLHQPTFLYIWNILLITEFCYELLINLHDDSFQQLTNVFLLSWNNKYFSMPSPAISAWHD
jgi:hypothetical protein